VRAITMNPQRRREKKESRERWESNPYARKKQKKVAHAWCFLQKKMFRVASKERETAIGYKKAKINRDWVQILHFYHAKTVNIDMRLLWRSVASTKAL